VLKIRAAAQIAAAPGPPVFSTTSRSKGGRRPDRLEAAAHSVVAAFGRPGQARLASGSAFTWDRSPPSGPRFSRTVGDQGDGVLSEDVRQVSGCVPAVGLKKKSRRPGDLVEVVRTPPAQTILVAAPPSVQVLLDVDVECWTIELSAPPRWWRA